MDCKQDDFTLLDPLGTASTRADKEMRSRRTKDPWRSLEAILEKYFNFFKKSSCISLSFLLRLCT